MLVPAAFATFAANLFSRQLLRAWKAAVDKEKGGAKTRQNYTRPVWAQGKKQRVGESTYKNSWHLYLEKQAGLKGGNFETKMGHLSQSWVNVGRQEKTELKREADYMTAVARATVQDTVHKAN
jgi:hypothetical protein